MEKLGLVSGIGLSLVLLASPARADYPADAPVHLFNLPDLAGLTTLNLELQYTHWEIDTPVVDTEVNAFTFDIAADIDIAPHWVGTVRLPFAYASVDTDPDTGLDCCDAGLGNLTLGVRRLFSDVKGEGLRTVFGGELALSVPTADDDAESSAIPAALSRASHDLGRHLPDTWVPRLNGHFQMYGSAFLLQAELGFHFFIRNDDDGDDDDVALRAAIAGGLRLNLDWSIVLELNNMVPLDDDEDDSFSSLDFGFRYGARGLTAGIRFFLPIDDRRDVDMFGIGGDVGWRF